MPNPTSGSPILIPWNCWVPILRVHMLDRLLSLDSSSVPLDKPLSAPMFHLGASLSLDPALLDVLSFSATPPSSAFCPSSDSADFLIAFYSGFIMLWAIRVHVPGTSLDALLPSSCMSSSSSASSSSLPVPSSDLSAGTSSHTSPVPASSLTPVPPSPDVHLSALLSQLSAQVLSLSHQVAALQQSPVTPSMTSVPAPVLPSTSSLSPHPMAPAMKVTLCLPPYPCLITLTTPIPLRVPSNPRPFPRVLVLARPVSLCHQRAGADNVLGCGGDLVISDKTG